MTTTLKISIMTALTLGVLWLAGPGLLLLALGVAVLYVRRRGQGQLAAGLSEEEEARLRKILED